MAIMSVLHRKNVVIEWSSKKASAKTANRLLAREIERMDRKGYDLKCSNIIQEGRSKRSWLFLGILNFVRGKQVQATAVFVKRPDVVTLT